MEVYNLMVGILEPHKAFPFESILALPFLYQDELHGNYWALDTIFQPRGHSTPQL